MIGPLVSAGILRESSTFFQRPGGTNQGRNGANNQNSVSYNVYAVAATAMQHCSLSKLPDLLLPVPDVVLEAERMAQIKAKQVRACVRIRHFFRWCMSPRDTCSL